MRHVSRWTRPGEDPDAVAKFAIALLACLRGSICLYQGEELGLEEAEIAFEDLRDPYGIRFWPGFKGRDGCRTPMVWEAAAPNAGFSSGKPWLPVPESHCAKAVDVQERDAASVLSRYRAILAMRKRHPALSPARSSSWNAAGSSGLRPRRHAAKGCCASSISRTSRSNGSFRWTPSRTFCRTPALLRTACLCFPDVAPSLPGF